MGVKFKTGKNEFPAMERASKVLSGKVVKVGVFGGEHEWLASIHEYGCKIPVTDKMRAFLHYKGIHLKPSTTVVTIPERSFIRAGHDEHADTVLKSAERALPDVLHGFMDEETYCRMVGEMMAGKIKTYAINLKDPPNSGWTVAEKGSSNPLVDTGDMIGHISYVVEDEG